jgi:hypothetical protein
MQMEITRNAQSPDAASRKIKCGVWLLRLAELQKVRFQLRKSRQVAT